MNCSCLHCSKSFKAHRDSHGIYCSNKCQIDYQYISYINNWLAGKEPGFGGKTSTLSKHIRRYLREKYGTACSKCGWDCRHPIDNLPLTEIDHIDGNAENCQEGNLRILCPNCHSLTTTFRARNKTSSRKRSKLS